MNDNASPAVESVTPPQKGKKDRSPAYPFIGLKDALQRTATLWGTEKRNAVPVPVVAAHWDYSPKSSGALQTVSALKQFGLLTEEGTGDKRHVRLSDFAMSILREEEGSDAWLTAIKSAALKPEIFRYLWDKYEGEPASDATIHRHLLFDLKFNDEAAKVVIRLFRDAIAFAKLSSGDKLEDKNSDETGAGDGGGNLIPPIIPPNNPAEVRKTPPPPLLPLPPMTPTLRYLPIPLDIGDAPIPVGMSSDDFDLLLETLKLWKKKIVRAEAPEFPKRAIWHNNDSDTPVNIIGKMGEKDGETFYQSADGTGIPSSELSILHGPQG